MSLKNKSDFSRTTITRCPPPALKKSLFFLTFLISHPSMSFLLKKASYLASNSASVSSTLALIQRREDKEGTAKEKGSFVDGGEGTPTVGFVIFA